MIKIYGSPQSSSGRCYLMLEECGLKYERVPLNMQAKEHKSESYLKINPNGKVPTLIDEEITLWESLAINRYLAEKHKPELLGKTIVDRAHVEKWSVWALVELQAPLVDIIIQTVFVPENKRDLALIDRAKSTYPRFLEVLDKHLADKNFMVGGYYSLADVNVASVVNIAVSLNLDMSAYKNIMKWFETLRSRPAFKKFAELAQVR